jgi:hypothetical protein
VQSQPLRCWVEVGVSALPAPIFGMGTLNLFDAAWLFWTPEYFTGFLFPICKFFQPCFDVLRKCIEERSCIRNIVVELMCAFSPHDAAHRDWHGQSWGFPGLPVCVPQKTRGHTTRARVFLQNRMKNLTTAVQVSIDTAVQHCEVKFSGRKMGYQRRRSCSCSGFVLVTGGWKMEGPRRIVGGLAA